MELKILTYNIWDLHFDFVKDRQSRFEKIIQKILELDADIVCLQESWDPKHRLELRERLTPKYNTTIGPGKIKTRHVLWKKFDTTGGLVIFSKFPIESWGFKPFARWPNTSLIELFARKGFLSAILNTPVGLLKIIDTHLQASHGKSDTAIQKRQLKEMLSRLNLDSDKIPSIIAGDFNKNKMMLDPDYNKIIFDCGFKEPDNNNNFGVIPTHRPENKYTGSWLHPAIHPEQFDYFLVQNFDNLENAKVEPLYFEPPLSDHDPVMLTITIR